ncbi:MAG: MG2 domain-containing protein [Bacteroidota bacterium]
MFHQSLKTSLFFLLLVVFCLAGCRTEQRAKPIPAEISSYVYAYTSGVISRAAPIRIKFTQSVANESTIGSNVSKGIFSISPSVEGVARWENDRTILLETDQMLQTGQRYLVKLRLDKLFKDVPKAASAFEFDFQTREQNFELLPGNLEAVSSGTLERQQYKGSIYTADYAEGANVEKLLTAQKGGKALPVRWTHKGDGMTHDFLVEDITRGQEDSELKLSVNGKPLAVDKKEDVTIAVPSLSNFKLMDGRVIQEKDQYVALYFSDPLSSNQNFDGMARISGYSGKLKYAVDGNQLRIYPAGRISGDRTITIAKGIRNINQLGMQYAGEWSLSFIEAKPEVRLVGTGVIMPDADGLIFPFEAINLKAVDVEVFKIYDNNILQFLQRNRLDGESYMEQVGRIIAQKRVDLQNLNPRSSNMAWTRYALDLKDMLADDPTAIYQIRIGIRQEYTNYYCSGQNDSQAESSLMLAEDAFDESGEFKSILDIGYYGRGGYYNGYRWEHRKDPCYPAYYNRSRVVSRNVLASNIGITAKGGDTKKMHVAVSDIRTTAPLGGVELDIYDYQQQLLKTITTDGEGMATFQTERKAFAIVARKGLEKGYLRLADGNALSMSKFDVAGTKAQKGLKGYLYGERGVWRPGDSIYLNFVLEDKGGSLPSDHPITFEVTDARNQQFLKKVSSENVNKVYPLAFATSMDDPTGNWSASVKIGGATFRKTIKVETVKPNRLKIKYDLDPAKPLAGADLPRQTNMQVNWLHGAPARNLKAKVEVQLKQASTSFSKYKTYRFTDPARKYNSRSEVLFNGNVNNDGVAAIDLKVARNQNNMPGKMKVNFRTRAFEKGGGYSEDNFSIGYDPFESYAGISIPRNRYGSKRLDVDKEGTIDFVLVDKNGKELPNRKLNVGLYRVAWRWWWERNNNNFSSYNTSTHLNAEKSASINTNSRGEARWAVKVPTWGRYMVRICDEATGHCSGDFFYAGYPWYDNDEDNKVRNREAASMLVFSSDKEKYETGDKIQLRIPTADIGRALITIENGSEVLESHWQDCKKGETNFEFYASAKMAPTVYAHVSLMQPHSQVKNDLPVRMYGVIPIHVEDPKTRLEPELKMADVLQPEQTVKIEVSEKEGRPMAYTIAMVDEGLLDLTRFKTPNPWSNFYAREALGIKTWDVYDYVLGAYGGQMERLLSVGGDDENAPGDANSKANRFEPVVRHLGPFFLKKGKTAKHEVTLPNYVGSVRTMVVAADNGAYGNTEKTTPVRKPLMVLATLPRVLGPGEQLSMPVNVFAMESKVKEVTVQVEETSGLVEFPAGTQKSIRFAQVGDEIVEFDLKVLESVGVGRFKITASGGGETVSQEIEIDIRNPNPYATDVLADVVDAGTIWEQSFDPMGIKGTNTATLEVSSIPPLNLDKRLRYLLNYPHGCVEQTTSGAFPQLYVGRLIDMDEEKKQVVTTNIEAAIKRLRKFQTSSGGLGYWPGDDQNSHWGTNYAGHFLLEAKKLGYSVPNTFMDNWTRFQKRVAKRWDPSLDDGRYSYRSAALTQAYRLYTLALAGSPELGAMNRLRESKDLSNASRYRLASAYALAGQKEIATQLVQNVPTTVKPYRELSYTYGSDVRDLAMMMESLLLMGDRKGAGELGKTISDRMSGDNWYSTQTTAYALMAFGKLVGEGKTDNKIDFAYQINGGAMVNAGSSKPVHLVEIPMDQMGRKSIKVTNKGGNLLYARVINQGQPIVGDQSSANNHLKIAVNYKGTDGKPIDPSILEQGMDFVAEVTITNPGTKSRWYEEMALSQVFPSGWEILNTRMSGVQAFKEASEADYQDIRDDRIYTYFDIGQKKAKVYRVQLNAAYRGRYYLPSISCDAMYDNTINARQPGQWVEVIEPRAM